MMTWEVPIYAGSDPPLMAEKQNRPFQLSFNGFLGGGFPTITLASRGGLILIREFDERLVRNFGTAERAKMAPLIRVAGAFPVLLLFPVLVLTQSTRATNSPHHCSRRRERQHPHPYLRR
jgi:hypothetical protein